MILKEGDRGKEVSKVQKLLSMIGYDLIIDGIYGSKTARSVRSFQKKYNLKKDGIVGPNTMEALKAAQKKSSKENDSPSDHDYGNLSVIKHHLSEEQYIKQKFNKNQIFIHFTAGSGDAKNTIDWWDSNQPRIATSYVIDRNTGQIYESFDPDFWSFHLGIKGTRGKIDKHSIGIELCDWGPLEYKNGKYFKWPEDYNKYTINEDEVYALDQSHRGYCYYQSYTDKQIEQLEQLLIYLVNKYDIPVNDHFDDSWYEYQDHIIKDQTPGIWTHVNVRKDKQDSYPDDRLTKMLNNLKSKI